MIRPLMDGYELGLIQFLKNETYLRGLGAGRWTFGFHELGKILVSYVNVQLFESSASSMMLQPFLKQQTYRSITCLQLC
jgi:hypothetical protein